MWITEKGSLKSCEQMKQKTLLHILFSGTFHLLNIILLLQLFDMCVGVCACVWERDTHRHRQRERVRDRERPVDASYGILNVPSPRTPVEIKMPWYTTEIKPQFGIYLKVLKARNRTNESMTYTAADFHSPPRLFSYDYCICEMMSQLHIQMAKGQTNHGQEIVECLGSYIS